MTTTIPPFRPGQRVRHAGKILQVSNCERRVAANRVRWVVESLDGVHVFAELCELVPDDTAAPENVADPITRVLAILKEGEQIYLHLSRIVTSITDRKNERYAAAAVRVAHDIIKAEFATRAPAERRRVSVDDGDGTVTTIIEPVENPQPAPVRYACSKVAKAGDRVKYAGIANSATYRVTEIDAKGGVKTESLDGCKSISVGPASAFEFVPEAVANLPETPDSSAVAHPVCRGCGKPLNLDLHAWMWDCCPCNSPRGINHGLIPVTMCSCDECQAASKAKGHHVCNAFELADAQKRLGMALKLLGQSDSRLFLVSGLEVRHKDGKWRLFHPGLGKFTADEFADPVAAALRAVELSQAAKGSGQ